MREWLKRAVQGVEREAWVRFLLASGGLAMAFVAALLSTASAEAGDLLSTAVLATSALMLAVVVGVVTVPYLLRSAISSRISDSLHYEVTREGVIYLLLTLLIAVGALNTGNNLLFIVVAAMLSAVLISGIASAVMLNGLELELVVPKQVFALRRYPGSVQVSNFRRFLPAFSISVVSPQRKKSKAHWHLHPSSFAFPPARTGLRSWFRVPDLVLEKVLATPIAPEVFGGRIYLPFIPPRQSVSAELNLEFPHRGRYRQQGMGLATRFPFSFLKKTRIMPLSQEVLVYPAIEPTPEFFEVLPFITGELETWVRGRGHDLYRIRDYQPEDSARHVDWKSTAKSGTLKVREFTREDERRVRLVFDNPRPESLGAEDYESAVSLAASLAWHFVSEGTDVSFVAPDYQCDSDLYHFLEYLAEIYPSSATSVLDSLELGNEYNVVITTRPRGSIPTAVWETSYILFLPLEHKKD